MRIPTHLNVGKWALENAFTVHWDDDFRSERGWEWPEKVVARSGTLVWHLPAKDAFFWAKGEPRRKYLRSYELWA